MIQRKLNLNLALIMGGVSVIACAEAAETDALRVVVQPSKTEVRIKETFKVVLRVENRTATNHTVRVMNCSWDAHWKSSDTNVSWLGWACAKNFAVNVDIPPGDAYTNQMEMLVLETAAAGTLSYHMGFTPIDSQTTFWSDNVRLNVFPPESPKSENPAQLLVGTWQEHSSTNTIEFQAQRAVLAPILKLGYAVRGSQLVFEKPANVVIEKLDMQVDTNSTVVRELQTRNEPPYTNWIVSFRVTQDELEITWDDQPRKYVRVAK